MSLPFEPGNQKYADLREQIRQHGQASSVSYKLAPLNPNRLLPAEVEKIGDAQKVEVR